MEKINIAELLKDCPKGMELDCTVFENLTFEEIGEVNSRILCNIQGNNGKLGISFNKFGCYSELNQAKCVIFPKGKTTWEGFVPPIKFKDGDVVISTSNNIHLISCCDKNYGGWESCCSIIYDKFDSTKTAHVIPTRLATEEEKQKLFQAIKDNGYKWNLETKTLEKLVTIFKIGDKIKLKDSYAKKYSDFNTRKITEIKQSHYILDDEQAMPLSNQNLYELVPNKFDISSLIPFESRVLVRNADGELWKPAIYGFSHSSGYYVVGGAYWAQCIPYEANKELLRTTNNPEEYGNK